MSLLIHHQIIIYTRANCPELFSSEYGLDAPNVNSLIKTFSGNNELLVKGFSIQNSSNSEGSIVNITDDTDRLKTTFRNSLLRTLIAAAAVHLL